MQELISTVGFPIAVCIWFLLDKQKETERRAKEQQDREIERNKREQERIQAYDKIIQELREDNKNTQKEFIDSLNNFNTTLSEMMKIDEGTKIHLENSDTRLENLEDLVQELVTILKSTVLIESTVLEEN